MSSFIDIKSATGISIYFPFLDGKEGHQRRVASEVYWLILYSLLADKVILSPSSVFRGRFVKDNVEFLGKHDLLRFMIDSGVLVATSTNDQVSVASDLVEYYSGTREKLARDLDSELDIYFRDEWFQRKLYADRLTSRVLPGLNARDKTLLEIQDLLSTTPKHNVFIQDIEKVGLSGSDFHALLRSSRIAYFVSGRDGNGAIMPPSNRLHEPSDFDFMYSKRVLLHIARMIESKVLCKLDELTLGEYERLRNALAEFRYDFFKLSESGRDVYDYLHSSRSMQRSILGSRLIINSIAASVAMAVGLTLSPLYSLYGISAAVGLRFAWGFLNSSASINNQIADGVFRLAVNTRLVGKYHREFSGLVEKLNKSLSVVHIERMKELEYL